MTPEEHLLLESNRIHPERRSNDSMVLYLMQQVSDDLKALDAKLSNHMVTEVEDLAAALAALKRDAFPDGDEDGHRRAHEAAISRAEEQAVFWKEMRIAAGKWLGLGLLGLLAGWIWLGFVQAIQAHK